MTDTPEKPEKSNPTGPNWTGRAALAGAAIGSAALAAALLYASRRKEAVEKTKKALPAPDGTPDTAPETD